MKRFVQILRKESNPLERRKKELEVLNFVGKKSYVSFLKKLCLLLNKI